MGKRDLLMTKQHQNCDELRFLCKGDLLAGLCIKQDDGHHSIFLVGNKAMVSIFNKVKYKKIFPDPIISSIKEMAVEASHSFWTISPLPQKRE